MTWSLVPVDSRTLDWPRKIAQAVNFLLTRDGMGVSSTLNSTSDALIASATYTGTWEANDYDQVGYNVQADEAGTFYLDVSPDGGTTVTSTLEKAVRADEPQFGTLVKGAGHSVRARFVNGGTGQTAFVQKVFFGDNLFPYSASSGGEILTTVTERERDVFANVSATGVAATTYKILIDLSDTTNFPHSESGRIDLSAIYIFADRDATAVGTIKVGVITRVDGTDADITYVQDVTFNRSDTRSISRDRRFSPSQLKCSVVSGATNRILASDVVTGVTAVNTATPLDSPRGAATVTPAVGDIIVLFEQSAGTYDGEVSCSYHGEVSSS